MGYLSKVQLIERANQFYLICPAPLVKALELQKGETIEWIVEDRNSLLLRRPDAVPVRTWRNSHAR